MDFDFMIDFAQAFERRYRDTKKRNHCLSIEWKYIGDYPQERRPTTISRYGEDAMWLGLQAWAKVDDDLKNIIRIAFGIGAKSQTAYEDRLENTVARMGATKFNSLTDKGLRQWYEAIKAMAGSDFELFFNRLNT